MFTVERLEYNGNSLYMIAGRNCDDYINLNINDVLIVYKGGNATEIKLHIIRIELYGKSVDEVCPGYTASLFIKMGTESMISLGDELHPCVK
jgi:hypothetical protein